MTKVETIGITFKQVFSFTAYLLIHIFTYWNRVTRIRVTDYSNHFRTGTRFLKYRNVTSLFENSEHRILNTTLKIRNQRTRWQVMPRIINTFSVTFVDKLFFVWETQIVSFLEWQFKDYMTTNAVYIDRIKRTTWHRLDYCYYFYYLYITPLRQHSKIQTYRTHKHHAR